MKIVIQSSALADLTEGFDFYERNEPGLGAYFLDSLYSDIDSLQLYAGIHHDPFRQVSPPAVETISLRHLLPG